MPQWPHTNRTLPLSASLPYPCFSPSSTSSIHFGNLWKVIFTSCSGMPSKIAFKLERETVKGFFHDTDE
jgi:hypothetical protein